MTYKTLVLNGIEVEVTYTVVPKENRNFGHPDNRLPDEPEEILVHNVAIIDWDDKVLSQLIKESKNA